MQSRSHRRSRVLGSVSAIVFLISTAAMLSAEPPFLGGETSIVIPRQQMSSRGAFGFPATNLELSRRDAFFVGNSFFRNPWVTAPASTKARDGLGPLFNTSSCQTCHVRDGRGAPPKPGDKMVSMLARISLVDPTHEMSAEERQAGVIADPVYGTQLQNHGVLDVPPEAKVEITWEEITGSYADGTKYRLRKPKYELTDLGYGPLHEQTVLSGRVAPGLVGVGLLDSIPSETIVAMADPHDEDGDGISGKLNQVWSVLDKDYRIGRFGWKAEQPTVRQQVAAAFSGDLGITSSYFPNESVSASQTLASSMPSGGSPEISDEILDFVVFYCKTLAVPAQRAHDNEFVLQGQALFRKANCASCHVETLQTGIDPDFPELSKQEIHPFTDLLLHDMGEGLADQRPVFDATGSEWKTPPLWGIGLIKAVNQHTNYLHDGRARSLEEAILWHGGEAEASRDAFLQMDRTERRQLVAFLKSL